MLRTGLTLRSDGLCIMVMALTCFALVHFVATHILSSVKNPLQNGEKSDGKGERDRSMDYMETWPKGQEKMSFPSEIHRQSVSLSKGFWSKSSFSHYLNQNPLLSVKNGFGSVIFLVLYKSLFYVERLDYLSKQRQQR